MNCNNCSATVDYPNAYQLCRSCRDKKVKQEAQIKANEAAAERWRRREKAEIFYRCMKCRGRDIDDINGYQGSAYYVTTAMCNDCKERNEVRLHMTDKVEPISKKMYIANENRIR